MRKHLGTRLVAAIAAVVVIGALAAGAAFAAPVLQPGQTSAPGMSGTCTDCHTYAKAAPVAAPVLFSRPFMKGSKVKRNHTFKVTGYIDPSVTTSATAATVTVSVERLNKKGKWVATPSLNQTATVSATGNYANKLNYVASFTIGRLGKYRLRAKLVYLDASSASQLKWSKPTTVTVKK